MVRLKTRWLLVNLDFFHDSSSSSSSNMMFPTRKDFASALRDSIVSCFGTSSNDAAMDVQVRLCDAKSGLVLFRVSRGNYAKVRASVTMLTSLPISSPTNNTTCIDDNDNAASRSRRIAAPVQVRRVTASVVSVHGSIRTAKIHTMRQLRQRYQQHNNKLEFFKEKKGNKAKLDRELQECLVRIQSME